jgi:hypothetical protein
LPAGTDTPLRVNDTRQMHESVGIARGYFEVR